MNITDQTQLFMWNKIQNQRLTEYFFASLYINLLTTSNAEVSSLKDTSKHKNLPTTADNTDLSVSNT